MADILNDYFIEPVKNLDIEKFHCEEVEGDSNGSPEEQIERILKPYCSHLSIIMIKDKVKVEKTLKFADVDKDEMFKGIYALDPQKATNANDVPKDILISSNDIVCRSITTMFNEDKNKNCFPQILNS